ncbi:hypothetical protein K402DRAFT_398031 [Aulographum hederae CBS 113979]|uniref:Uncharacterized protein n=1 Tax=Aulographum hederae CBS 113979 TaxID=1176131 RepID=A0A6G1GMD5_9PEZI|nr:hypothetical protein K402DRAFT_398031 [Aulographum hederae CBS 113979]
MTEQTKGLQQDKAQLGSANGNTETRAGVANNIGRATSDCHIENISSVKQSPAQSSHFPGKEGSLSCKVSSGKAYKESLGARFTRRGPQHQERVDIRDENATGITQGTARTIQQAQMLAEQEQACWRRRGSFCELLCVFVWGHGTSRKSVTCPRCITNARAIFQRRGLPRKDSFRKGLRGLDEKSCGSVRAESGELQSGL